jgi:hypothetical protein
MQVIVFQQVSTAVTLILPASKIGTVLRNYKQMLSPTNAIYNCVSIPEVLNRHTAYYRTAAIPEYLNYSFICMNAISLYPGLTLCHYP